MTSVIVRSCTAGLVLRSWIFSVNVTPSTPARFPSTRRAPPFRRGSARRPRGRYLRPQKGGRRRVARRTTAGARIRPSCPPSRTSPRFSAPRRCSHRPPRPRPRPLPGHLLPHRCRLPPRRRARPTREAPPSRRFPRSRCRPRRPPERSMRRSRERRRCCRRRRRFRRRRSVLWSSGTRPPPSRALRRRSTEQASWLLPRN